MQQMLLNTDPAESSQERLQPAEEAEREHAFGGKSDVLLCVYHFFLRE